MKLTEILNKPGIEKCVSGLREIMKEYLNYEIKEVNQEKLSSLNKIFSALANPIRLKILTYLMQMPLPVCIITELLGLEQTLVSHHLKTLRDSGLITVEVRGKYRFYRIACDELIRRLIEEKLL